MDFHKRHGLQPSETLAFRTRAVRCFLLAIALTTPAAGQLAAPNPKGVSMGHVHLISKDAPATKALWVSVLGTTPASHASLDGVRVPGMYIWIKQGEPSGGTDGSTLRDLGFRVKQLDPLLDRAAAAGLNCRRVSATTGHLLMPDNVLLELIEDPRLATDIAADHLHLFVKDAGVARQWYGKLFGDPISGIRLNFITTDNPGVSTKGRAVDHIGFEVTGLEAFAKEIEAGGIKLETPFKDVPDLKLKLAFLSDPWGTLIELTEGLVRDSH